jgi:hypothetical protein
MMSLARTLLPLVALFVVATPVAYAGNKVLVSAPIANAAGGIACLITNAGTKPVTISAMETYGGTRGTASLLPEPVTIPPGGYIGKSSGEIFGYCRFVVDKNPKTLRAVACKFELGNSTIGTTFECVEAH